MMWLLRYLPRVLRRAIIRRSVRFDPDHVAGMHAELALTPEDALAAAEVLHDAYVGRRLMFAHESGRRVTPTQVLPSTFVLVAKHEGRVVGTISLQVDSAFGLPMEEEYGEFLTPLRAQGRVVAEVGALAVHRDYRNVGCVHLLNCAMFQLAERLGVQDLVMVISEFAEDVYQTLLCFERLSDVRGYPGLAEQIPSVALRLPLDDVRERLRIGSPQGYRIYIERDWNEVKLPNDLTTLSRERLSDARLGVTNALVRARKDVFNRLNLKQAFMMREMVPAVHWPTPLHVDRRELAAFVRSFRSSAMLHRRERP